MNHGTACRTPGALLVHIVAFETAYTWCSRKTDRMRRSHQAPTCFACIAKSAEWQRQWPKL